jgi:ribonuclease R
MESALRPLWQAHAVLAHARGKREPLEIELPERRIVFGADGSPCGVTTPPRLEAHRLIEEFMIQANVASAETLEAREGAFLRRIHDAPAAEKVDALGTYAKSLDLSLPRGQILTTRLFNRLLDEASATAHGEAVAQAVLRAQSQAFYGPRDRGHFGLNLRRYAHFTSPIRRYADIIVHRALISALALGPDGHDRETIASLDEIGERLSEAERVAMAAERATQDRLVAQFLSARVGATFTGRIAGMVRSGLFVELDETGANGFVAAADLGRRHGEYFLADESAFSLSGRDSGLGYRIGERVEVRLTDADPVRGTLDFEMLTPPRALAKTGSSGKTRRRARRARPAG